MNDPGRLSPYPRSPSPMSIALSPPPSIRLKSTSPDLEIKDIPPDVPVPWKQLIPLLIFPVSDAMTYAVVFPIITDMVTSFNVPSDKIGLYAGLGEGAMMLVEAVCAPMWAKLADKYGRKLTLTLGFAVCAISCPILGFSGAVWQVVLWRSMMGLNSGGVVCRTMAAELSHPTNRARIFSILSPSFSIGMLLGTFLGGELAHPYGRLPSWLGGTSHFWKRHPFALPFIICGIIDFFTVIQGLLFLVETRPPKSSSSTSHDQMDIERKSSSLPIQKTKGKNRFLESLKVPSFCLLTLVMLGFQISTFSWDGLYTVYTYTDVEKGGLGLPVDLIGLLYSAGYLVSFILNPVFLPKLSKKYGPVKALNIALLMWPALALLIPLSQWTALNARWSMWIVLSVQLALRAIGSFGWALCDVLTLSCFDDYPDLMAAGSAISLIGGAGGRAFGPAASGWLFSISTQYPTGSLMRQISWVYLVAMTLPAILLTQFVSNEPGSRPDKDQYEAVPMMETEDGRASIALDRRRNAEPDTDI